jgi:hypothetical protein
MINLGTRLGNIDVDTGKKHFLGRASLTGVKQKFVICREVAGAAQVG